jgi:hypothetical protein
LQFFWYLVKRSGILGSFCSSSAGDGWVAVLLPYRMLRFALMTLSAAFGGIVMFALYASFYNGDAAVIALLMLSLATVMVRVTQEQ